jgi:hypothetical protein
MVLDFNFFRRFKMLADVIVVYLALLSGTLLTVFLINKNIRRANKLVAQDILEVRKILVADFKGRTYISWNTIDKLTNIAGELLK